METIKQAVESFESQVDVSGAKFDQAYGLYFRDGAIDKELSNNWMKYQAAYLRGHNDALVKAASQ